MTTTPTELLSTDCVECGLHFDPDPREVQAFRAGPVGRGPVHEQALRYCLSLNDWTVYRRSIENIDEASFQPTCPKCTERLTAEALEEAAHPKWGCTECEYDLTEGLAIHSRYWQVSGVDVLRLSAWLHDDDTPADAYDLGFVERCCDLSADEALLLSSALLEVCKLLDEHGLRKPLNEQVSRRLHRRDVKANGAA